MDTTDLTLTILRNIREDIAKLSSRFDGLESRFDGLEFRFDGLESRVKEQDIKNEVRFADLHRALENCVSQRQFSSVMRLSEERFERMYAMMVENNTRVMASHQELQDTVHQIMVSLGQHGSLAARVDRCEQDIVDLKDRVFRP